MLPLPTTAIPLLMDGHNAPTAHKVARCLRESRRIANRFTPAPQQKSDGLGQWTMPHAAIGPVHVRLEAILKPLGFFSEYFVRPVPAKQFSRPRNHFPLLVQMSGNSPWVSSCPTNGACRMGLNRTLEDRLMRTLSFILAFAFLLAGPSMAGSSDNLPAAGAFAYNGAPTMHAASLVLAAR
jgi:hypothetical protein